MIRLATVCYAAASRLWELKLSRSNIASQAKGREGAWSRRTFPFMVLLHTTVLATTLLAGGRTRKPWLLLFLAVQPVRRWVLQTLGDRWNARGVVPDQMAVATTGPYALVRHPNYSVVAVELFSLPAAFGLFRLAVLASLANAVLLTVRIREEEQLLMTLPSYKEHFQSRPRFVPIRLSRSASRTQVR